MWLGLPLFNAIFQKKYNDSPKEATDYFYELSKNSNYIQMNRIQKNMHFKAETIYGEMDITINMSKPEKDPEQIEREKNLKHSDSLSKMFIMYRKRGI